MIKSEVLQVGSILDVEYPIMKRWFGSETYALFSTAHHAIIVAVSEMHSEVDFVGQQVSDPTDRNWHTVNNFRIVLSDCEWPLEKFADTFVKNKRSMEVYMDMFQAQELIRQEIRIQVQTKYPPIFPYNFM